jgi:hypothetical protein
MKAVFLAAKKAGATIVEVPIDKTSVIVHLDKDDQKPVAQDANEWAVDDAHKA